MSQPFAYLAEHLSRLPIPAAWWQAADTTYADLSAAGLRLVSIDGCLSLASEDASLGKPLVIDWVNGKTGYRLQRFQHEAILKAVSGRKPHPRRVIDATTGLGRDALLLAAAGHQVVALERHPVTFVLLLDAWERAQLRPEASDVIARLTIEWSDALTYLTQPGSTHHSDVICVDPMFPERGRNAALVKKEMRLFRLLAGADTDADRLLERARECARERVVVKRPRAAPPLADAVPSYQLSGKTSRFDIYLADPRNTES